MRRILTFSEFHLVIVAFVGSTFCQCPDGTWLTFTRTSGFQPRLPVRPALLYSHNYGSSITAECYNRCRGTTECLGFILDYATASCFRVDTLATSYEYDSSSEYVSSPGVAYFAKICLPLTSNCTERAWSVEAVPGYELLGLQHTVLPNIYDRVDCMAACIQQATKGEPCLSANYFPHSRTCTLSSHDRWTDVDNFVAVPGYTLTTTSAEYLENQCLNELDKKVCWRNAIVNKTSIRSDLMITNVTSSQCRERCVAEISFHCRAYSWVDYLCSLHSDPALNNVGPLITPQLEDTINGEYVESIACVNLNVTCDLNEMNVTLLSKNFQGQISVQGHSNDCSVLGKGRNTTTLTIVLPPGNETTSTRASANPCQITVAHSIGDVNRTLASAVIVVQYHELIQRAGDRVVKVNCLVGESNMPVTNNLTLGAGFSVSEPPVQSEVTGVGGNLEFNGTVPKATMMLLDARTGGPATDVQLGDPLILRIDVPAPFNVSQVRVGHLIASSGNGLESLLLLDWSGCPPNPSIFPGMFKTSDHTLEGQFSAFRFQSSPLLSFNVVITFSRTPIQPTDCGNGNISYGKRRKRASANIFEEVPLQLTIMVHAPEPPKSSVLQASFGGLTETDPEICTSFLTAAILVLFFVLLQCVLLAMCCCVLHRKEKEKADTISLRHDFNPMPSPMMNRHVTFSDDYEIPARRFRLTTPVDS